MESHLELVWHEHDVTRGEREQLKHHRGCVVWFTGLSGSGKSTIANRVDRRLWAMGIHSMLLDGDNLRLGLNATPQHLAPEFGAEFAQRFGLGFGTDDRTENIRRIGAVSQLFCAAGIVTLTAFVSPYRADRDRVRRYVTERGDARDFLEVYVSAPLEVCEARDPKGLYQKARAGAIERFTGISDPYEPPLQPELILDSSQLSPEECSGQVVDLILRRVR